MVQTWYKLWAQSSKRVKSNKPQCQLEFMQVSEKPEEHLWCSSHMILSVPSYPPASVFRAKPGLADPLHVCQVCLLPLCWIACLAACNHGELLRTKGDCRAGRKIPSFHLNVSMQIGQFLLLVAWLILGFLTGWPPLAGHQRSSPRFQTGTEPGSSWSKGCVSGSGISPCTEGGEMLPDLKGTGVKFAEFVLRVRRVSSCCFEEGTCLSGGSCPTGDGLGKALWGQWHSQQNSLFTSGFLGRADTQHFSVAVRKFFS